MALIGVHQLDHTTIPTLAHVYLDLCEPVQLSPLIKQTQHTYIIFMGSFKNALKIIILRESMTI